MRVGIRFFDKNTGGDPPPDTDGSGFYVGPDCKVYEFVDRSYDDIPPDLIERKDVGFSVTYTLQAEGVDSEKCKIKDDCAFYGHPRCGVWEVCKQHNLNF